MMRLLLTHGYFLAEDPKEQQIMKPYPPLGLLYICSHLRAKGFAVEVFDSTFSTMEQLKKHLQTEKPSVLGIYANLMTRKKVIEILQTARLAGWTTVVGGPEPGAYVREYLDAGAEVVVLGEGEATIRMVRETQPDDVGVSVSYPLPGTKFHQIVAAEVGAKTNWNDSSDLTMMFRGEYPTEVYRALAVALHAEVIPAQPYTRYILAGVSQRAIGNSVSDFSRPHARQQAADNGGAHRGSQELTPGESMIGGIVASWV